ncbi:MAG: helix-turn-helix domain-containing protein [Bacteroidales bacterium]|nr:helix-turn-helix domain-containing protein [Bacteroidales bacterium]
MSKIDIKKIRESVNMTQNQFASAIGVSLKTIQNWESGTVIPKSKCEILRNIEANNSVLIAGNSHGNIDNRHYYSDSPDVLRTQIEEIEKLLKEKEERIKEKDAQIKEKDAQIKQLLNILEKNR